MKLSADLKHFAKSSVPGPKFVHPARRLRVTSCKARSVPFRDKVRNGWSSGPVGPGRTLRRRSTVRQPRPWRFHCAFDRDMGASAADPVAPACRTAGCGRGLCRAWRRVGCFGNHGVAFALVRAGCALISSGYAPSPEEQSIRQVRHRSVISRQRIGLTYSRAANGSLGVQNSGSNS